MYPKTLFTVMLFLITYLLLIIDLIISTSPDAAEGNKTNGVNTFITDSYEQFNLFQMTESEMCNWCGAYAQNNGNKTFYYIFAPKIKYRKKNSKSMLTCFKKAKKSNSNLTIKVFDRDFLNLEFPTSIDCQMYQNLLSNLTKDGTSSLQLKVGEIDNIDIFAVVPRKFSHIVFIEKMMHDNIDRILSMFEDENQNHNPLTEQSTNIEFYVFSDLLNQGLHLLTDLVKFRGEYALINGRGYTIAGPASLLYLLGQQMRCNTPDLFEIYIKNEFFVIEKMSSDWMIFNITKKSLGSRHNVTFVCDKKNKNFVSNTNFSDLFKVTSVRIDGESTLNENFISQVLVENINPNPDSNCYKNVSELGVVDKIGINDYAVNNESDIALINSAN